MTIIGHGIITGAADLDKLVTAAEFTTFKDSTNTSISEINEAVGSNTDKIKAAGYAIQFDASSQRFYLLNDEGERIGSGAQLTKVSDVAYDIQFNEETETLVLLDADGNAINEGTDISACGKHLRLATGRDENNNWILYLYRTPDTLIAQVRLPAMDGGAFDIQYDENTNKLTLLDKNGDPIGDGAELPTGASDLQIDNGTLSLVDAEGNTIGDGVEIPAGVSGLQFNTASEILRLLDSNGTPMGTGAKISVGAYDLQFDENTNTLELLDANGNAIGSSVEISTGVTGLRLDTVQDKNDNWILRLYNEDDELLTEIQLPATGGGGGGTGSIISLTNVTKTTSIRDGETAPFSFTATSSDDTDITASWYVNDTLYSESVTNLPSGSTFNFNAQGKLVNNSSNRVRVVLTSEGGGSLTRSWTVTSSPYSIEWGEAVSPVMLYTTNEDVYVTINAKVPAGTTNIVSVQVGSHSLTRTITGSRLVTVGLNKDWFMTGTNTVTAGMQSENYATDGIIAEEISLAVIWAYQATDPIVAWSENTASVDQYDTLTAYYFAYDPSNELAVIEISGLDDGTRELTVSRELQRFEYAPQNFGSFSIELSCGTASDILALTVAKSTYNIAMVTGDALQYNLNPSGHSNSDNDRSSFANLVFEKDSGGNDIFDWVNGGFQNDADGAPAFVVKKGYHVTLPRCLFADADGNGKTIDISFRITNSDQYNAVAIQELNNGGTRGLTLRANEGELHLDNATGQIFRYCEENRIDMSVLVEGVTTQRVMTTWLDGIPSMVRSYSPSMLVQNENACVIGSNHCDVWVYAIRVYNAALGQRDMIQNYISLGSTTAVKVARCIENNIYNQNDVITPESLHAANRNLTIIEIDAARMSENKKDKVPATIRITDGATTMNLSVDDGVVYMVQGTSSVAYARSALNLDIDFKKTGQTYKLSENSIPVSYLNIKVNVASSENANNACAVDWYNTYQPFLIEARRLNDKVRDTVESKPCAVFFKNTGSEGVWISSQFVNPGQTVLYVMGDLCNSKKNLEVFGQDGSGEHPTKACIEISGNDTPAQRFKASSTYDPEEEAWITNDIKDYEWRMDPASEDLNAMVTAWNNVVAWLISTDQDAATNNTFSQNIVINGKTYTRDTAEYRVAKFKAEVGDYFTIDSLLFHFLYLEYFAAYDQVSKNTFYSYDYDEEKEGYRWNITKCYDADTILAYDNDGNPLGDYGLDYGDTIDGTPTGRQYFNANTNTIWCNIQAAFYNELSAMYISLKSAGAWNSLSIANKWDQYQARRPHAAMVQDMYNKYIEPYKTTGVIINGETKGYDDNYISRLAGSKIYQRRQFLTYQTNYMDGKYGYYTKSASMQFRTNGSSGTKTLTIKSYAKTYITVIADDSRVGSKKVAMGETVSFNNVSVGNNTTIYITPDSLVQYVRPLNETYNSTFAAAGAVKLTEAILGGEIENTAWMSGTSVMIPSVLLKELSIRNMTNYSGALNLSSNIELEVLDTRGTNAGLITLPSYAPLRTIQLNACTGIVAFNLLKVQTFTMEGGEHLSSIRVENCNSVLSNEICDYLVSAVASEDSATKRIRITSVNWTFDNIDTLYKIATRWKGFSNLGEEQDTPVITGTAYVNTWSNDKLSEVRRVFPDLVITVNPEGEVGEYTVTFRNYDESQLGYPQKVTEGDSPTEPDLDTPPTRPSTTETAFEFDGWSYSNGGALISDLSTVAVSSDMTLYAHYAESVRKYVISWYNGTAVSKTLLDRQYVDYNTEAVYAGSVFPPVNPNEGVYARYYLFTGWDKSTGRVHEDMDVYAQYDYAGIPQDGSLSDWSPEELNAMIETNKGTEDAILKPTGTTAIHAGDTIDILAGNDYHFTNVDEHVLIDISNPMTFNGENFYKPTINGQDIRLWDADKSWTLAVDCQFDPDTEVGSILVGAVDNYNGFSVRCTTAGTGASSSSSGRYAAYYGRNSSLAIDSESYHTTHREIVVFRHKAGNNRLYMYASNKNAMNIGYFAPTQSSAILHNAPLAFGCEISADGYRSNYAIGTVFWAKLWDEDLGDDVVRMIAAWPRQTFTMEAVANSETTTGGITTTTYRNFKRANSNTSVNCAFLLKELLEEAHAMHNVSSNDGGIGELQIHTWLNTRIINALPIKWRNIIVDVTIKSLAGGSNPETARAIANPPATGKIWIPSSTEVGLSTDEPYINETDAGAFINFTGNRSRIRGINFGSGDASNWWLRTPYVGGNEALIYAVTYGGTLNYYTATTLNGIAFGFCI